MIVDTDLLDAICTAAREAADAPHAFLIVIDHDQRIGIAIQASLSVARDVPQALRWLADDVEQKLNGPES